MPYFKFFSSAWCGQQKRSDPSSRRWGSRWKPGNLEDGMQSFLMTVTVLAGLFILYTVVKAGSMNDSDREKIGHGPKGQGR